VKTYHYTRHAGHCSATDPPRGRIRRVSYPKILEARPYPFPIDPASTNHQSTKKQGLHATGSRVFSPSHPLRHRGVQGWPAILGARRYSSFHSARQNFTSKASPASLPPLDPIKGQAGDSMKRDEQGKARHHPTVEDQHLKQSPLYYLSKT
jgi:hypothetical protein